MSIVTDIIYFSFCLLQFLNYFKYIKLLFINIGTIYLFIFTYLIYLLQLLHFQDLHDLNKKNMDLRYTSILITIEKNREVLFKCSKKKMLWLFG